MPTIDERMAALLKDHQRMGARPMDEPVAGDAHEPTLPLRKTGHAKTVAHETAIQKGQARARAGKTKTK